MCWKCNRTLITLEILGEVDKFKNVFDMEKWENEKKWYVPSVILNKKNKDPLIEEIRQLAKNKNYEFGVLQSIFGFILGIMPKSYKTTYLIKKKYFMTLNYNSTIRTYT